MAIVLRTAWALISAALYQLGTNVYIQALLLALHDWRLSLYWLASWWVLVILAVAMGVTRKSRLPGLEQVDIFTARKPFTLLGDEQQGWRFPPGSKLPRWLLPYVCCGWRNKLRNLAFWRPLAWLHVPPDNGYGVPVFDSFRIGGARVVVKWQGWMTEFTADWPAKRWFIDLGPRLDQPGKWGAVSWAFRIGRY